jgi:hypothetical protein
VGYKFHFHLKSFKNVKFNLPVAIRVICAVRCFCINFSPTLSHSCEDVKISFEFLFHTQRASCKFCVKFINKSCEHLFSFFRFTTSTVEDSIESINGSLWINVVSWCTTLFVFKTFGVKRNKEAYSVLQQTSFLV